ncbi:MAG: hypothetical protein Q8L87_19690, partial [Anaerolineales bacterium]|nr:hypothetical protein [Anaerolineales bacterium]
MSEYSADEQIKTVYAHFGLALYLAQVLEHGLANALIYSGLHRFRWVISHADRFRIQIHSTAMKVNGIAKTFSVAKSTRLSFDAL